MKRFIKHILLFFLIFFIVEKVAWFLLDTAPKREYDTRLEQLINGKINKDLIVIGSSRGAGNILAGQLEQETGLSSYNLSYQGTDITFHEFILKTLIRYNNAPKYVLLNIDSPGAFLDSNSIIFRTDILLPYTNNNYINSKLIEEEANNSLSHIFLTLRLNRNHFRYSKKVAREENPLDVYGSMPLLKDKKSGFLYHEIDQPYDRNMEQVSKLSALKRIQDICSQNNIKLTYIISPSFKKFSNNFYERLKGLSKREEHILVYDTLNPIYKNEAYFFDAAHLMKNGAQIFTSEISKFIKED